MHSLGDDSLPSHHAQPALEPLMATSRDQPNPLRPYYIPPSIGLPSDPGPSPASRASPAPPKPSLGSQARDILSDLDYGVDLTLGDGSPSAAEMAKKLLDQAVWNYTSVLFAQPFEVAKTVLQLHSPSSGQQQDLLDADNTKRRTRATTRARYNEYLSDSDSGNESPSYFSSTAHRSNLSTTSRPDSRSPRRSPLPRHALPRQLLLLPYKLELKRADSLLEVLSQIWNKEGALAIWKGTNSTFVYNFLLKTLETWMRSLLSALLNVPDPGLLGGCGVGGGGLDVVDSPNPLTSLAVGAAAAGVAGLVLAPLDMVRTRFLMTPWTVAPRHILPSIRNLPSLTISSSLLPITLLCSTVPTIISASTPLILRSSLRIDPVLTPTTYSICTFISSATELFIKLPLETVLRRGQAAILTDHAARQAGISTHASLRSTPASRHHSRSRSPMSQTSYPPAPEPLPTVVDIGPYRGVVGTMWHIVREEGSSSATPGPSAPPVTRTTAAGVGRHQQQAQSKGQGMAGLVRGWRVGFWGLVGVWGAAVLGGSGGGEF